MSRANLEIQTYLLDGDTQQLRCPGCEGQTESGKMWGPDDSSVGYGFGAELPPQMAAVQMSQQMMMPQMAAPINLPPRHLVETQMNATCNLNSILSDTITNNNYYVSLVTDFPTFEQVVEVIREECTHLAVFEPGKGHNPSVAFCCMYRLAMLQLDESQLKTMLEHSNVFVRCVALLWLRNVGKVENLIEQCLPHLEDETVICPFSDRKETTVGKWLLSVLTDSKYCDTVLRRIPIPIVKQFEKRAMEIEVKREWLDRLCKHISPGLKCEARWTDGNTYAACVDAVLDDGRFLVTYTQYGNQEEISASDFVLQSLQEALKNKLKAEEKRGDSEEKRGDKGDKGGGERRHKKHKGRGSEEEDEEGEKDKHKKRDRSEERDKGRRREEEEERGKRRDNDDEDGRGKRRDNDDDDRKRRRDDDRNDKSKRGEDDKSRRKDDKRDERDGRERDRDRDRDRDREGRDREGRDREGRDREGREGRDKRDEGRKRRDDDDLSSLLDGSTLDQEVEKRLQSKWHSAKANAVTSDGKYCPRNITSYKKSLSRQFRGGAMFDEPNRKLDLPDEGAPRHGNYARESRHFSRGEREPRVEKRKEMTQEQKRLQLALFEKYGDQKSLKRKE